MFDFIKELFGCGEPGDTTTGHVFYHYVTDKILLITSEGKMEGDMEGMYAKELDFISATKDENEKITITFSPNEDSFEYIGEL